MYRYIAAIAILAVALVSVTAFAGSLEVNQKVHALLKQARYEEALIEATRYLDETERTSYDPFTFAHANKLVAQCLIAQDLNSEAETYLREALEIQVEEKARLKDIADTISTLIYVYEYQGKFKQADELNAFASAKYGKHTRQDVAQDADKIGANTVVVTADEIPGKEPRLLLEMDAKEEPVPASLQVPKGRNLDRQFAALSNAISELQNILFAARDCDLAVKSLHGNTKDACSSFHNHMSSDWQYCSTTIKDLARDREFVMAYSKQFALADRLMEDITEMARYTSIRLRFRSK